MYQDKLAAIKSSPDRPGGASPEKQLLANILIQRELAANEDKVAVTDAEIDAYYQKHRQRYAGMEKRPGGKEAVRKSIESLLKSQKRQQVRKDIVAGLKQKAEIVRTSE